MSFIVKTALIQVWLKGDVGGASISYQKQYRGDDGVAQGRFARAAEKKFPNWESIRVERV